MSNINVPFCPWIPNNQVVPTMCPGHYKKAQSIVIKYVHSIIFHPGCYASAGSGPTCEQISGICVTQDHCEQGFTRTVSGYGHLM